MTTTVHHGDCIDIMRTLPAESVDAIVTSPPYAMQRKTTYGGIPEKEYPAWTVAWMSEAKRLLKPDGSAIINISPHINKGELSDYVLRTRLAIRESGWNEVDELVWFKPNATPTGSPVKPKRSWESLLWYSTHQRPYSDAKAMGTPPKQLQMGLGPADRANMGHAFRGAKVTPTGSVVRVQNVLTMPKSAPGSNAAGHPAPFPWKLAEWCGKLICPPGGTILDPFSGSASTGVAAIRNGWNFIGIDAVAEYVEISRLRLEAEQTMLEAV